ncbi:unnamed protein product [Lymnaea stagnalis]|uniref:BHLH domain-containing protein n=1 Tax=Lymnaea stagnalis TaxID=6523 RepID=A0AAV2II87_LYMST
MLMTSETSIDNITHECVSDPAKTKGFQTIDVDDEPQEKLPKIASVKTLAQNDLTASQWEDMAAENPRSISQAPEHGTMAGNMTQSSNPSRHKPAHPDSSDRCSGYFGQTRQHYGWHTSMVCLKAKSPPCPQEHSEDDVQEEDEVKLLEFAANCNWEGAKKEILGKVAQCLTRGQYPQPRTMNVCEFVVEILPKAHQPSLIPPELRSKLPVQMYSIRVRITRREHMKKEQSDIHQVIDLSESSPNKGKGARHASETVTRSLNEQLYPSNTHPITAINNSPDQANSTSVGISGLSKLCITNSAQKSSCVVVKGEPHLKPGSVYHNRRSSLDSAPVICLDDSPSATFGSPTLNVVRRRGSFMQLRLAGAAASGMGETPSNGSLTTVGSAATPTGVSVSNSKPPSHGATQVVVSPKDVKYVKIPGKDGVVEVIVGPSDKKLIRLTNKQMKVIPGQHVNLPVCGSNNFPSQSLLKTHSKPVESHLSGAHKIQEFHQRTSNIPNRSLIPTSMLSTPHEKCLQSGTAEGIQTKTPNSNDEMIMVFDAAHIKALQNSKDIAKNPTVQLANSSVKPNSSVEGAFDQKHTHSAGSQTSIHQDKINVCDRPCFKPLDNSKHFSGNETNSDKITVAPSSLSNQLPFGVDVSTSNSSKLLSHELQSLKVASKTEKDSINFVDACPKDCVDESGANTHHSALTVSPSSCDKIPASALKLNERDNSIMATIPSKTSKSVSKAFGPSSLLLPLTSAKHIGDFAPGSSKRNASYLSEISQHPKKPRVSAENSLNIDEDSNVSLCSVSDLHIAAASPVSFVDRPKSVLSTSISTASTDDFLIMLSSEEDVDVGENDIPAAVKTKGEKPERALENDHVSLYAKENKLIAEHQMSGKTHRKTRDKNLVRLEHHNKLERMRRSKLRALFDDLQQHVLKECGLPEDHSMSKANVLIEAKRVILKLCKTVKRGDAEIRNYEKANKALQERLTTLKGNKARVSESPKTVIKIVKKLQQLSKTVSTDPVLNVEDQPTTTSHVESCHELQLTADTGLTEACHDHDTIDLLSPSSDEDKLSDGVAGVHEEMNELGDHLTPKIKQLACVDDIKYEDISDPDER